MGEVVDLITKSFESNCIAFPSRVDKMLATIQTVSGAADLLAQASAMSHYAKQLQSGIDIERPISLGVLKIKAKIGELAPAKTPKETGAMKGKKGSQSDLPPFDKMTIAAYRKIAAQKEKLEEYYAETEDVPTQAGFLSYASGAHVSQNSGDNEWYTPSQFIEAAIAVMGSIDCDPATSKAANTVIKAKTIYTESDDGLTKKWKGNIWMNPPYAQPAIGEFCKKLADECGASRVTQAITLTNNATETKWFQTLACVSSAFCFPLGRVKFWHPSKESVPLQGQAICYVGENCEAFAHEFKKFGIVAIAR